MLQARPITSLPEASVEPIPIELEVPPGFWQRDPTHSPRAAYHIDLLFFPLIRETTSTWAGEFGYLFDGLEFREIGLWLYMRMVPLGSRDGPMPPSWLMWLLARTLPMLRRRVRQAAEAVRTDKAGNFIQEWYDVWQPELTDGIFQHLEVDLGGLSDLQLDRHVVSARALVRRGIEVHSLLTGALAVILYELATTCEQLLGWDLTRTLDLVAGTSFKSTEPARRLHGLAEMAKDRPRLLSLLEDPDQRTIERIRIVDGHFARSFDEYLHRYGCRALGYTFAEPTLAEMPELFLDMIRGQLDRAYDPAEEMTANSRRRSDAREKAMAELSGGSERKRFLEVLERAERAYPVREDNEFYTLSAPIAVMRYALLEIGRRLAARGVIDQTDDVMFLELEQARSAVFDGGDLCALVRHRKGQRAWAELHPGPPFYGDPPSGPPALDFLPNEARLPMEAMLWSFEAMMEMSLPGQDIQASDTTLRGIGASPGRSSGPVRVVMDEGDFDKLRPGDVMVCPVTSPVWSVLFPMLNALVTDAGGVLSHPAIIAREYRIPAVVATGDATTRLKDGQIVVVDGSAGTVMEVT